MHGQSQDGYPCWRVLGNANETLDGSLWDAHSEPLLVLRDNRPENVIENDKARAMEPIAALQVRCFREDLEVYDIKFKDEKDNASILQRKGSKTRLRAAEAFLKAELLKEGLIFGDLTDLYSELRLADVAVPLYD